MLIEDIRLITIYLLINLLTINDFSMKNSLSVIESFVMVILFKHENWSSNCGILWNSDEKLKQALFNKIISKFCNRKISFQKVILLRVDKIFIQVYHKIDRICCLLFSHWGQITMSSYTIEHHVQMIKFFHQNECC